MIQNEQNFYNTRSIFKPRVTYIHKIFEKIRKYSLRATKIKKNFRKLSLKTHKIKEKNKKK